MKVTDDIKINSIINKGVSIFRGDRKPFSTKTTLMMHNHYDLDITGMELLTFDNVSMYIKKDDNSSRLNYDTKAIYCCRSAYAVEYIIKDASVFTAKMKFIYLYHYTLNKNRYFGRKKLIKDYYIIKGKGCGNYIVDGKMIFDKFLYDCDAFDKNGYAKIAENEKEYYIVDTDFKKVSETPYNTILSTENNYHFNHISQMSNGKTKIDSEYWIVVNRSKDSDSEYGLKIDYNYMLSNGKLLCKKWYANCQPFFLGIAKVSKKEKVTRNYITVSDGIFNFVDSKGHEVFDRDFCGILYIANNICDYYLVYRRDRRKNKVCNIITIGYHGTEITYGFMFKDFWLVEKPKDYRNNVCIIQRANDKKYTFLTKYLGMPTKDWFDECTWTYRNCAILKRADGKMNVGKLKGYRISYMSDEWVDEVEYLGKSGMFKFVKGNDVKIIDHEGCLYRWPDLKLLKW